MVAVAGNEVAGVLADWQGTEETAGYAGYYDGTGSLSLLDREAEAVAVRSLVFQVRAIANMRLAPALGLDGEASTDAIPAGAADNSREDLLNQLGGIAGLYRGAEGGFGLSDRVRPLSPSTDARMLDAIESAISAVSDLTGSIIAQLEADQTQVIAAYDRIKELQLILNTEIVSLLGVSVGLADGGVQVDDQRSVGGSGPSGPGPGQQFPAHPVQLADVAPPEAAQEGSQGGRRLDHAADGVSRPTGAQQSASSMQSPPASEEATRVSILSPGFARPGASPRSTCLPTSSPRPRRWARVTGRISPAFATKRWSSKAIRMRSGSLSGSIY